MVLYTQIELVHHSHQFFELQTKTDFFCICAVAQVTVLKNRDANQLWDKVVVAYLK